MELIKSMSNDQTIKKRGISRKYMPHSYFPKSSSINVPYHFHADFHKPQRFVLIFYLEIFLVSLKSPTFPHKYYQQYGLCLFLNHKDLIFIFTLPDELLFVIN